MKTLFPSTKSFLQRIFCPVMAVILATVVSQPLFAQNRNAGEIRGTLLDQSGAAMPGATVTLTNIQTGITSTLSVGNDGLYDAPSVEPGTYNVTFFKEGFKKLVRSGIVLHVETITLDAQLQIGSSLQEVTVEASTPIVQTETSDRRLVLTNEAVTELPIVGGSWYALTGQLAGVNPGKGGQDASGEGIGVNGTTSYSSNWLIDGGVGTFPVSQNPDFARPPLDAIAEVNFNTSNFAAEYGSGVAVFNVITKSGSNHWHGSAYEYVQNDVLEARNFFAPNVTPLRWNEFGGTFGGPIKRDKLFFFFSYQRNPTNTFSPTFYTFPTAPMRVGDFSAAGLPTVYDPASVNGQNQRTAFPGNKVPVSQIDPVAAKIQAYLPMPSLPGLANNYYYASSNPVTWTTYDGKLDYNLAGNNRLTGSFLYVQQNNFTPAPTCPMDCNYNSQYEYQGQITDVWTLSPSLVNEARISTIRTLGTWYSPNQGQGYPAKLGLNSAAADAFPTITVDGTVPTKISGGLSALIAFTSYVTSDTVTWVKGKHILKFGGELDKWQDNEAWDNKRSGSFDFDGIFTRNPADPSSSGLGYADFLVGLPDTWSVNNSPETGMRDWNLQAFVQDDYKITPKLTLNLGVRYQFQTGWTEQHNRLANFDPALTNPETGTPGALWFAGQNGSNALQNSVRGGRHTCAVGNRNQKHDCRRGCLLLLLGNWKRDSGPPKGRRLGDSRHRAVSQGSTFGIPRHARALAPQPGLNEGFCRGLARAANLQQAVAKLTKKRVSITKQVRFEEPEPEA
jgi:Carboxypeptidase regulatory-like domain/TonB-dependent Receptor Plug Domain